MALWAFAVGLCLLVAMAAPARAVPGFPPFPNPLLYGWEQPGDGGVDGVGAYLYLAPQPARPATSMPYSYEYRLSFAYENYGVSGLLSLKTAGPDSGAVVFDSSTVDESLTAAYPVKQGGLYFLLVHRLGPDQVGAWVLDVGANVWTFVGSQPAPSEWGRLSRFSGTEAWWWGYLTAFFPCTDFPPTDAYFTPAIGIRNGAFTVGTLVNPRSADGGCPSQVSSYLGWTHFHLGA